MGYVGVPALCKPLILKMLHSVRGSIFITLVKLFLDVKKFLHLALNFNSLFCMEATIASNKISVTHYDVGDINREFLSFFVQDGWDEVKRYVNKVLTFEGRDFAFSGWNSDRNEVYFTRQLNAGDRIWCVAEIKKN